jgi:prolipoprotein diacylglyceryltransferase
MFPTLGYLISYLFGINVSIGFPTFGLMVAISFILAAYTLGREMKRRQSLGQLNRVFIKETIGKPASKNELISNALIGFIFGYKIIYVVLKGGDFLANPQVFLLNTEGSIIGGALMAALFAFLKYREKEKAKLPEPKLVEREIDSSELVGTITMIAAISGILGAKIFHNLEYPSDFMKDPIGALLSVSGLTFYGGLIGGAAAVMTYAYRKGLNPIVIADCAAPGLMLAYATGRIGCMLSGDGDWGIVNTAPMPKMIAWLPDWMWAFNFPNNVAGEGIPIEGCVGPYCSVLPLPVYPTPFYETMVGLAIFAFLWSIRKKLNAPGLMFSVYLIFNGIERFSIEQIRVNATIPFLGMEVTQAQIISTCLMLIGIAGVFISRKFAKDK